MSPSPTPTVLLGLLAIALAAVAGNVQAEGPSPEACDASCSSAAFAPTGAVREVPAASEGPVAGDEGSEDEDDEVVRSGSPIAAGGYLGLLMASLGVAALAGSRRR